MTGFGTSSKSNAPTGAAGRLFLSLFFLVFLGMGAVFVWLVAREGFAGIRTWRWKKTNCEIINSYVGDTDDEEKRTGNFYFEVRYSYGFEGRSFTSDKHKRKPESFSDYSKAARLTERYRSGSSAVCYVNPSAPTEAILQRDNLLFPLLVLFPMIFVVIGGGGIYFVWRRKPSGQQATRPISDRAGSIKGQRFAFLFFLIFLIIGSAFLYGFFIRPVFKILSARQWPSVPCVVIFSEVKSHSGDDGTTYGVNILYSYEFHGREFKANRYDFMGGSSSGYSGKQAIVARHTPGTKTVCYVNPSEPTDAVLERGFTPGMWFGLIPLVFVLVGALGLIFSVRKRRQSTLTAGAAGDSLAFGTTRSTSAPVMHERAATERSVLNPKMSPLAKLLAMMAFALFWNGIVSVFVWQVVTSGRSGHTRWFLALFLVPFVLIGLGLAGGIIYFFLALFNPRPRLTITPGAVPLGETLRVEWEIAGRTDVLENLRVRLQGREEATYRRGTSTSTDKSLFADIAIAHVTTPQEMRSGAGTVTVPAELMHSFASNNNKIVWAILVHGEIARWPDVKETFPVTVLPSKRSRRGL